MVSLLMVLSINKVVSTLNNIDGKEKRENV